ncbi:MAG: pyridoxal 5'-phosphate synthase glutaminase subunit PdxT [Acidimicrobiales bacterium]
MDVGILALQGDVAEHSAALIAIGVAPRKVRRPDDLAGLDGIILPGGESTTMSMLLESSGLADPLGKELDAGLPALGTCAGMILLGTTAVDGRSDQRCFGAIDITVRRNGFGRQLESFECDLDVPACPGRPLHAVFIRAPLVESSGPAVEVLATLEAPAASLVGGGDGADGSRRGVPVLCRQGAVLVAAFHPELTPDRRVHELFVSMIEARGPRREEPERAREQGR